MEHLFTGEALVALLTLTALEIVLGIDNVIFVAILVGKLPREQQERTRKIGLGGAMFMRIGLLLCLKWIMGLTSELFSVAGHGVSGRDLILLLGGAFLIAKSTYEIHDKLEGEEHTVAGGGTRSAGSVIAQILVLDLVFSLDSVITAVGMARHIEVMIAAVVVAVGVMMTFAKAVGDFVERHPTMKMLALSFLLLIGFTLVLEGSGQHVSKGYIYSAMAFSLFVELLNLKLRRKQVPVHLREHYVPEPKGDSVQA